MKRKMDTTERRKAERQRLLNRGIVLPANGKVVRPVRGDPFDQLGLPGADSIDIPGGNLQ